MADFIFKISPNILVGSYLNARLGQYAKEFSNRYMVLLDSALLKTDVESKIRSSLDEEKVNYFVYKDIPNTPDSASLEKALWLAREAKIYGIIGVGGSRVINFAKCLSIFYNETDSIYEYAQGKSLETTPLPLICLPTTCKNEFLFSPLTPFVDARNRKTVLIPSKKSVCNLAIFDSELKNLENSKTSLPAMLNLAIETYVSQKSNFFSEMLLEKAFELIAKISSKTENLESTSPQEFLMQASCLISLAAGVCGPGFYSLLSMLIEGRFQIDAELTNAIFLPYMIEEVSSFKADKIAQVSRLLGLCTAEKTEDEAKKALVDFVVEKQKENKIPGSIKDLKISIEQLAGIAKNCNEMDSSTSFARSLNTDEIFELIKKAY